MNATTFEQRVIMQREAERDFERYCYTSGFSCWRTGQEYWIPGFVHDKLRSINDCPEITTIRHFPDYGISRNKCCLVQVKSAKDSDGYPSVTMELASYNTSKLLSRYGVAVLMTWEYPDDKFYGNWVGSIISKPSNIPRQEANGSHTPFELVFKNTIISVDELLKTY
jgi:hypothetical protein